VAHGLLAEANFLQCPTNKGRNFLRPSTYDVRPLLCRLVEFDLHLDSDQVMIAKTGWRSLANPRANTNQNARGVLGCIPAIDCLQVAKPQARPLYTFNLSRDFESNAD
jgi:hypothetical protein